MDSARPDELHGDLLANLAWVRRLALAIVRDDAVADDVAQDVAWTALRRSSDERPSTLAALRAWLATTARRVAIDRARAESARRTRERAVARPEAESGSADAVERGARSQRVVEAVMQLDEPYRSAILLRYLDQLPMSEVAARLGTSEGTARKRLTVGLARLRARLDGEFGEDSRSWALALLGADGHAVVASAASSFGLIAIVHGVLVMHAKFVAAGIGVVLVGLAAWFAASGLDDVPETSASARSANTEPLGLSTPSAQDAQRVGVASVDPITANVEPTANAGPFVIVRSSIGLPLPFVDVQDEREDWKRAELEHDRCALDPAIALPRLVRAPGHVPQLVTRFGEELVLEPDALLTLEGEDLRTRTRTIRVSDPYRGHGKPMKPAMRQAVAFGFLSDDTWCVAVSHDLVRAAVHDHDLGVEILWPDHQRADVHLRPLPGARGRWTVPVDRGSAGTPLRLHVDRPKDQPVGDVVFRVDEANSIFRESAVERFAWGSAVVSDPRTLWMDEQKLDAAQSEYTFDFLPTGVPLVLAARDETSSAYGRTSFVHDGSDRTLELKPGFVMRGCLLAADDRSPVTTTNFIWEFRDRSNTRYYWRCEKVPLVTDSAGCFEARGPMHVTTTEDMVLERPSRLVVLVTAPGFESFERAFDTAGAREFDCGELLLVRSAAQIVLAPGHGVQPKSLGWNQLRISSMPDVDWSMRGGVLNAGGSMSVSLVESEDSTRDQRLFVADLSTGGGSGLPWPSEPGRWLMIHVLLDDRDETQLFERQPNGEYAAVPRREVELDLKCGAMPPVGNGWHIGWVRDETWGLLGAAVPRVVGETSHVRFSIPVGAQLWWSADFAPPGVRGTPSNCGGTVSVDALLGRFVLR